MLPLYLFALIVGGGLLIFSLLGGEGSDSHDIDADVDVDGELGHGVVHIDHSELPGVRDFLSLRTLLYLMAGFGASGTLIDLLTGAPAPVSLAWAGLTGVIAATLAALIYGWVRRTDSGLVPRDADYLVGMTARVILPVLAGQRGKIIALHEGREVELLARPHGREEVSFPRGAEVVIVDIDGETALVTAFPDIPSDPSPE